MCLHVHMDSRFFDSLASGKSVIGSRVASQAMFLNDPRTCAMVASIRAHYDMGLKNHGTSPLVFNLSACTVGQFKALCTRVILVFS